MAAEEIVTAIREHKTVYRFAGIDNPPPYRLTCSEHKCLVEHESKRYPKGFAPSMIKEYCGVRLEVVMIVEPYL